METGLKIANEAQSATPKVLEVAELRLRPFGAASRTSSRFSVRVGFPAGSLGGVYPLLFCGSKFVDDHLLGIGGYVAEKD